MTSSEMNAFINNINELYKLKLTPDDARTKAWIGTFKRMDFTLAMRMSNLYYSKGNRPKFGEISPKDLFQMENDARRAVFGQKMIEDCDYCCGTGSISIKKYYSGTGWLSYAMRCFCSTGSGLSSKIEQMQKNRLNDYEVIKNKPSVLADPYIYREGNHTGQVITMEMLRELKPDPKKSKVDIFAIKEAIRLGTFSFDT